MMSFLVDEFHEYKTFCLFHQKPVCYIQDILEYGSWKKLQMSLIVTENLQMLVFKIN